MFGAEALATINNIGFSSEARAFPGFQRKASAESRRVSPRGAIRLDLRNGDLLHIGCCSPSLSPKILAFDDRGRSALDYLGLGLKRPVSLTSFDSAAFEGWVRANGDSASDLVGATVAADGGTAVLSASGRCTAWIVIESDAADLVAGASLGAAEVSLKRAPDNQEPPLPPPLGEVREEFTVARGTASAFELRRDEVVQIIDVEGQQCSDFVSFRSEMLERGEERLIDSTATRSMTRCAYPGPGLFNKFYDQDMMPMLELVQDTCRRHDTFGLACTARGYEERGFPGHVNCSDNISDAAAPFGIRRRSAWPAVNFFWNTWIDSGSGRLNTEESHSRPGDYVAMRAMDHLVCVSTACPDDIDPINGWNPTDVHVRIYKDGTPVHRAVAYREKEDGRMSMSQESAFHPRTSRLTRKFEARRDVWIPSCFPSVGTVGEYWACRQRATIQDMSSILKFDIVGPDAGRLLQKATTRDISKLAEWRGTYALMCDESGTVIDDGTLFRLGPDLYRWCCGTEESGRALAALVDAEGLQVRINALGDSLPSLAVQGPKSRDLLREIVFTQPHLPALDQLRWFGVTVARLRDREGLPFMLSRTGYTGELGFELFCARSDAVELWDAVTGAGGEFEIHPMGTDALEILRIEAGFPAANAEFAPGVDALEAGCGKAVDFDKRNFVGRAALLRNAAHPRRVLVGLLLECDDVPKRGSPVLAGERPVGVVTSAARSPMLERSVCMARIAVEHAGEGTRLEIGQMDGRMKKLAAAVAKVPFVDPQRKRARA